VERGAVVSEYECLATVFPLATGDAGVLSLTLPRGRGIEQLLRSLHRVSETIGDEVDDVERDGGW
jgi:hypothetical protein